MFDIMGMLGSGGMPAMPMPTPSAAPMPEAMGLPAAPPPPMPTPSVGGAAPMPQSMPGGPQSANGGSLGGGIDAMQQSNAWAQLGNSQPGDSLGGTGARGSGNIGLPSSPANPSGVLGKGTQNPFASMGKGMMQQSSAPQPSAPKIPGGGGGGGGLAPFQPMEFTSPTQLGGQGQGRNMVPRSPFAPF